MIPCEYAPGAARTLASAIAGHYTCIIDVPIPAGARRAPKERS